MTQSLSDATERAPLSRAELHVWGRRMETLLARAGTDPESFAAVVRLIDETRARLPEAAARLTAPIPLADGGQSRGHSWADIARALGVSRSAAHERFGPRPADPQPAG
jgi:hypothetical protein